MGTHNPHGSSSMRIAKNSGLLYVRQLFVLFIALFTSRLTLQILGETDFGIYAAVGGVTAMLSVFTGSMAGSTQRFMTFELGKGNGESFRKVYSTAFLIHIAIALILIVTAETVGLWFLYNKMSLPTERLDVAFWVFQLSLLTCVLNIINVPNSASIIAHEDMGMFAFLAIISAVLKLICVYMLSVLPWDNLILYAIFLAYIQIQDLSICAIICHRKYPEARFSRFIDGILINRMVKFAGWTIIANLSTMGFVQGVNLLLNMFFGPILNAAYTVAMQAYSGIRSFCSSFQLASNPQIVKLYSLGDISSMHRLVMTTCKISFFLIMFLSLPFMVNVDFILKLWLDVVPNHTRSFFLLLLLFAYLDVFAYPLDVAAQATGQIRQYNIYTSLVIISVLPAAYIAFRLGAIPETVYMMAIGMSGIGLMIRLFCLSKLINLSKRQFIIKVLIRSFVVFLLSLSVGFGVKQMIPDNLIGVVGSFIICFSVSAIIIFTVGLTHGERLFVSEALIKIRDKFL